MGKATSQKRGAGMLPAGKERGSVLCSVPALFSRFWFCLTRRWNKGKGARGRQYDVRSTEYIRRQENKSTAKRIETKKKRRLLATAKARVGGARLSVWKAEACQGLGKGEEAGPVARLFLP